MDGKVRHLMRKKYAALKKFRRRKDPERKRKLRTLSQNIKYVVRQYLEHRQYLEYRQYLEQFEKSFKTSLKNLELPQSVSRRSAWHKSGDLVQRCDS